MRLNLPYAALAVALAAAVSWPASADPATDAPHDRGELMAQLAAARADLDRAADRVVDLSKQLGLQGGIRVEQLGGLKPVVGVVLAPDPRSGVLIAGVTPDSPAALAGLLAGDRLTAIDGRPIAGGSADLRIANARGLLDHMDVKTPVKLTVLRGAQTLTLKAKASLRGLPAYAFVNANGTVTEALGDVLLDGDPAHPGISARAFYMPPPGVAPGIRNEVIRLGPGGKCSSGDCDLPLLVDAFRWTGLNLAAVDPQLGRYFGTRSGVLVLSAGDSLAGLQPGDVLRRIDGKAVTSPREAMAALRAHAAGSRVAVEYLRDRRAATTQVTVPKAMAWPLPPRPPAAPRPPSAPRAPAASPAPPAPSAPPAASLGDLPALPTVSSLTVIAAPVTVTPVVGRDPGDAIGFDGR